MHKLTDTEILDHAAAELEQLADDTEESHTTDGLWPDDPELEDARATVDRCRDLAAGLRYMLWKAGL